MQSTVQVAGILFADIVNFLEYKDDRKILEIQNHLNDFAENQTSLTNCFYKNTWGDAIVLASNDPSDSLEHALRLQAWFKNRNWRRIGFSKVIQINFIF